MKQKKLNLDILTRIQQDPDFVVKKSVADYLKDPAIASQVSQDDIDELKLLEKNFRIGIQERETIEATLGLNYQITDYFKLPIADYKKAIPIMLEWYPKFTDWRHREGSIRTLSTPWAKNYVYTFFIDEFKKTSIETERSLKWAIGNGLEVFAADDICDKLLPLVTDKKHGRAREMIVLGLGKMKKPENIKKVTDILIKLLEDDDVAGHAIEALGKLKALRARPYIEKFVTHKRTWWRNAAKKVLRKFDKLEGKIT